MNIKDNLEQEWWYKRKLLAEAQSELSILNKKQALVANSHLDFKQEITRVSSWEHALNHEVNALQECLFKMDGIERRSDALPLVSKTLVAFPEAVTSFLTQDAIATKQVSYANWAVPRERLKVSEDLYYIAIVQNTSEDVTSAPYAFIGVSPDESLFVHEHQIGEVIEPQVKPFLLFTLDEISQISPWYLPFALNEEEVML